MDTKQKVMKPLKAVVLAGGKKRLSAAPRSEWTKTDWFVAVMMWFFGFIARLLGLGKKSDPTKLLPGEEVWGWDIQLANGERCIDRVIRSLQESTNPVIDQIVVAVAAPDEVPEGTFQGVHMVVQAGETLAGSILAAECLVLDDEDMVVFDCADLPLSDAKDLMEALQSLDLDSYDMFVSYITEERSRKEFPDWPRTWGKFWDPVAKKSFRLCSGGIVVARFKYIKRIAAQIRQLEKDKKSVPALAGHFGLRILMRLVAGRCTMQELEKAFNRKFGIRCKGFEVAPGLGHDIDDAKRLRMTKKHDELRRQQINCDPILIQSDVISLMRSD